MSVQFPPYPRRWFWTSVPSPAFFLSLLSRQELLESTLQSPAKWANTHRSVVLRLSSLSLCFQLCRVWEVKVIQCVGFGEPESENPVLQYTAYTKSTYITCRAWHSEELMGCGNIWPRFLYGGRGDTLSGDQTENMWIKSAFCLLILMDFMSCKDFVVFMFVCFYSAPAHL